MMQLEEAGEQGEAACCISSINVSGLNLFLVVPRRGQRPFIEKTCCRVDVRHEINASNGGKTQGSGHPASKWYRKIWSIGMG